MVRNEDDARELTQLTWIKAWQKVHTFHGDAAFTTWVHRIATYTTLDFLRKRKRQAETVYLDEAPTDSVSGPVAVDTGGGPDQNLDREEIRVQFRQALEKLSPKHRATLILREIEGLSYAEIAKAMKCRVGTVMSRIFTARKSIQKQLKDFQ